MKTEALIEMLARDAGPAPVVVAARRLVPAVALGLLFSCALALVLLGPVEGPMFAAAAPWIKLIYASALAIAAGWLTARLARPLPRIAAPCLALLLVVCAMAFLGLNSVLATPHGERVAAVLGKTWFECPIMVLGFSLPALAGTLWAVRGLAPTRLRGAGFAAGLLAGCVGAFGYALACPEGSAVFVAVWYSIGICLTALLGAMLGRRVLWW